MIVPASEQPVSSPGVADASGGCSPPGTSHTPSADVKTVSSAPELQARNV